MCTMFRQAVALSCFLALLLIMGSEVQGNDMPTVRQVSLYADLKARAVGDIVTVTIIEQASASNTSRLTTRRNTKFDSRGAEGSGPLGFIPEFSMAAQLGRDHEGTGQLSREGRLTASIAAVVVEIRPNGDLVIEGQREVTINEEKEILTLRGVVRPEDIDPDNIVYSTHIAEAEISYKGKGVVTSGSRPNFLVRLLSWVF